MRSKGTLSIVLALILVTPVALAAAGMGPHFGRGNIPAGCSAASTNGPRFTDNCYHMRTGLNHLDTPIIDVLLTVPVGPYAERDLRVMRQAVEMWAEGIQYLAPQMGLDWLTAVEFNILIDDDTFTTDPAWDPEIVVVSTNGPGGAGIGIDPIGLRGPCRGANPLASFAEWEALPGFDSHHQGHSGTYVETCEGGGTTCYAVNGAIDPVPGVVNVFGLYDLVAHEVGHCLSLGHVGDALDHKANAVPVADIMAYTGQAFRKCVSSLDVETFALRMSRFLLPQALVANHAIGPGGAFQIQHPDDHYYASTTGLAKDCPQPHAGLVPPAQARSFTPENGARRSPPALEITSHEDGETVVAGLIQLAGTVHYSATPSAPPAGASSAAGPAGGAQMRTVTLQDDGTPANTFFVQDSSLGERDTGERFTVTIDAPSDVVVLLTWQSSVGEDDLDLFVTGVATNSSTSAFTTQERLSFKAVPVGELHILVDPYLISDALVGATYALTVEITPVSLPGDADGDGVPDAADLCPNTPVGTPVDANGCPFPTVVERVVIAVDGVDVASEVVSGNGGDAWAQVIDLTGKSGPIQVRVAWYEGNWLIREKAITLLVE